MQNTHTHTSQSSKIADNDSTNEVYSYKIFSSAFSKVLPKWKVDDLTSGIPSWTQRKYNPSVGISGSDKNTIEARNNYTFSKVYLEVESAFQTLKSKLDTKESFKHPIGLYLDKTNKLSSKNKTGNRDDYVKNLFMPGLNKQPKPYQEIIDLDADDSPANNYLNKHDKINFHQDQNEPASDPKKESILKIGLTNKGHKYSSPKAALKTKVLNSKTQLEVNTNGLLDSAKSKNRMASPTAHSDDLSTQRSPPIITNYNSGNCCEQPIEENYK